MSRPHQPGVQQKKKWPRWIRAVLWVVGVLAVLQLVSYIALNRYAESFPGGKEGFTQHSEAWLKLKSLEGLLALHKRSTGRYPTEKEGIGAAFTQKEEYKKEIGEPDEIREKLLDPWKRRYQYRCPGVHNKNSYDLYSLGPDGIDGTEDDIKNWK